MTPPNVQFIPAAISGWSDLISGTTTSNVSTNYYVTHTNIDGNSIWNGRGANFSWYFNCVSSQIQFYFANDTDRSAALAAYSSWRVVGTDGTSEVITPLTMTASRLRWIMPSSFTALTTYTIQGQP